MNLRQDLELSVVNCCPVECELNPYCKEVHQRIAHEEVAVTIAHLASIGQILPPPLSVVAVTRCSTECEARSGSGMPDILPDVVVTVRSLPQ